MIKFLIVDDEHDVEMLFRHKFRKEVQARLFDFTFAFSGKEALAFLETLEPFDVVLVLTDINMPGMTGLELLAQIRKLFPSLNVIIITAYADEENRIKAIQSGATDLFAKPVDFKILKERILSLKN